MNVMQLWESMCPLIRSLVPLSSRSRLGRMLILSLQHGLRANKKGFDVSWGGKVLWRGAGPVVQLLCRARP